MTGYVTDDQNVEAGYASEIMGSWYFGLMSIAGLIVSLVYILSMGRVPFAMIPSIAVFGACLMIWYEIRKTR